jgi:hypothetical protein
MLSKGFSGVLKFCHAKIPDLKFPNTTRFNKFILKNYMKITKTHRCTNIMLHPPLDTVQYFPEVKNLLKKILLQRDKRDNSPESSFARKDETKPGSLRTRFIYTKKYRTK